jgi:hypothetical protein
MRVYMSGVVYDSPTALLSYLETMGYDVLTSCSRDISDAITQCSIILDPAALSRFSDSLSAMLDTRQAGFTADMRRRLNATVADMTPENRALAGQLVGQIRAIRRSIGGIVASLGSMSSQRASSTRAGDLRRIIRSATIRSNLERIKSMGADDIYQYLESIDDWMIVVADEETLVPLLTTLGDGQAQGAFRRVLPAANNLRLAPRCPALDGITVAALANQTQGQDHPFAGKSSLAIPQFSEPGSAIPVPMFPVFMESMEPCSLDWMTLANSLDIATYRIGLRGTICNATATRHFSINPASKELSFFLTWVFLQTALSIPAPAQPDASCEATRRIRALVGMAVTTMASGQTPVCSGFSLFTKNPHVVPQGGEAILMNDLMHILPATGWLTSDEQLRRNVKTYLVRMLGKYYVHPLTEPYRKSLADMAAQQAADALTRRNAELSWLALAIKVLFCLRDSGQEAVSGSVAVRLLQVAPAEPKVSDGGHQNGYAIVHSFMQRAVRDGSGSLDSIMQVALDIYVKRSGHFASWKKSLLANLGSEENVAGLMHSLGQIMSSLETYGSPHMQNSRSVQERDKHGLHGDAELKRRYFAISQEAVAVSDAQVQQIITGQACDSASPGADILPAPVEMSPLVLSLSSIKREAYELASRYESLSDKDIMLSLTVTDAHQDTLSAMACPVKKIIETLLIGWRDTPAAEEMAVAAWRF